MARIIPYGRTQTSLRGDVRMIQTPDDGDIVITNGDVEMTGGFETMALLCLEGGNEADTGAERDPENWWGNVGEPDTAKQYRSRTNHLIAALPPGSQSIKQIQAAVDRDLSVFTNRQIANKVEAVASMPARSRLEVAGVVRADGVESRFSLVENWRAMGEELQGFEVQNAPPRPGPVLNVWEDGDGYPYQNQLGQIYQLGGA